ncbi:MAG: phosphoenolpyruvate--protein phosphotransferase [Caldilineaceae bacterium]|nr:phosphoenolpyruvate--protein phosphotransferase [Caldilineaceae bacterium]
MVSIVLVSHSRELSAAVKALADQQIQGRAQIVAVGGSDNPHQPFGTDPVAIAEAIQSVFSEDGILVLMDLGSAIISGQVALDLLPEEQAAAVRLSVGSFVEGAMAAAVQASIGMDIDAVTREAEEAMQAKRAVLLHEEVERTARAKDSGEEAEERANYASSDVTVVNPAGLHFGPAARFIQAAAQFRSTVRVTNLTTGAGPIDASRFNQLLALGIEKDHNIRIDAAGEDAAEAVSTLSSLVAHDLGETGAESTAMPELPAPTEAGTGEAVLSGLPASPGVAIGVAVVLDAGRDPLHMRNDIAPVADRAAEWKAFKAVRHEALEQLTMLTEEIRHSLGEEQSIIFRAHILLLQDPDFQDDIRRYIEHDGWPAVEAVRRTVVHWAARFRNMSGAMFQQRAADVEDIGRRLLRLLRDESDEALELPPNALIVANDLLPSQTATLDRSRVLGFCTAGGGPIAHTAILARSMGIPAVVGVGESLLELVREGVPLAIDGSRGQVIIAPDARTTELFEKAQTESIAAREAAWAAARRLTRTRDGLRVEVVANLGAAADATVALEAGAEGVGLLRTEFLFQDRMTPPTDDEQASIYSEVAQIMGERRLIIRTLDIGGDKPAPYLTMPQEANPFLGWRAIRVTLAMPEFFKAQLRALLRAAVHGNVHIMFPMISTIDEVLRAQALLAAAAAELSAAGIPHRADVPVGVMIEVPAAVEIADQLAPLVDFFSIGTNDLTQYTFAADRTNGRVAALADSLHPAILRQIDTVVRAAHLHGRWVGLCGEMAGRVDAIPVLLGLGIDEFSMAPASIPAAKALLAQLTAPAARRLAQKALTLPDADAVRKAVRDLVGA